MYSPGASLAPSFAAEVAGGGDVTWLLAPNSVHHMGVPTWKEHFGNAKAVSSKRARGRLHKQGRKDVQPIESLIAELPQGLRLIEVPHTKIGEVWLVDDSNDGKTLITCDAFFNFKPARKLGAKLTQRMLVSGPGPAISQIYKYGGLSDRKAYKAWITSTLADINPTTWVPQHGAIMRGPGIAQTLIDVAERRL